ncbi:MAG: hypothetical protein JSW47_03650 [Phycisphaerales bacterium]|nr:MAG: hypothetical protein JSW47_03650 [Phycisphaerales bacterium]
MNAVDMCIMVDYWHLAKSLCDIGPTPLGDGTVDVQDPTVLAGYLFQEIDDPTLVAHWALDETDGIVAADTTGNNNGYVLGDAIWEPNDGQVGGALRLDGIDDFISALLILVFLPAGAFSIV